MATRKCGNIYFSKYFMAVRPDLMRDRKRRSKTKNGVFRSGFFDQKKIYNFS